MNFQLCAAPLIHNLHRLAGGTALPVYPSGDFIVVLSGFNYIAWISILAVKTIREHPFQEKNLEYAISKRVPRY